MCRACVMLRARDAQRTHSLGEDEKPLIQLLVTSLCPLGQIPAEKEREPRAIGGEPGDGREALRDADAAGIHTLVPFHLDDATVARRGETPDAAAGKKDLERLGHRLRLSASERDGSSDFSNDSVTRMPRRRMTWNSRDS